MHIPGSEKLILELPLVIGTAGLGSRSNSVSSQEGSVSNASQSWVSLRVPSQPPSYCDITRDCRLDQPLTPLLDDFDSEDSPIFMTAPAFQFPPPPAYAEVGVRSGVVVMSEPGGVRSRRSVFCSRRRSTAASPECCRSAEDQQGPELWSASWDHPMKALHRSNLQRGCLRWTKPASPRRMDRNLLCCSLATLPPPGPGPGGAAELHF